jgi:hypothetical protein
VDEKTLGKESPTDPNRGLRRKVTFNLRKYGEDRVRCWHNGWKVHKPNQIAVITFLICHGAYSLVECSAEAP